MSKNTLLLFAVNVWLSCNFELYAQPAHIDDSIMAIKKKWIKGEPFVHAYAATFKPAHFPVINKKIDSIADLFKQAYPVPTGSEAKWYASISGRSYFDGAPTPYSYIALFKYLYYNKSYKKLIVAHETNTWAYVFVNDLHWLVDSAGVSMTLNDQRKKIWKLSPEKGEWKGYTVFEDPRHAPNNKIIVVTKNGRMPWQPVTQKQYLTALRAKEEEEKKKVLAAYDEGIEKIKKMLNDYRNDKSLPQNVRERAITLAEAELEKKLKTKHSNSEKTEKLFAERLQVIDDYINQHSEASMQQQAIIDDYHDFIFNRKFMDPADKAARKLIYIDEAYFDKRLPSYLPQFFTLMWRWDNNTPALFFKTQLEEHFPVEKLKAMIAGKQMEKVSINDIINNEIKKIMTGFIGSSNETGTWTAVKNKISDYLTQQWKAGVIKGASTSQAFFVNTGLTTMTQTDIANGNLVVEAGFALAKPGEFTVKRFEQKL